MHVGIRELKNNLSYYLGRIEAGESFVVTAHGRAVAELVPASFQGPSQAGVIDQLIASGAIVPAVEGGDPLERCPRIKLPRGTANTLIDEDRGDA